MILEEIIDKIDIKHSDDVYVKSFAEEFFEFYDLDMPDDEDRRLKCHYISTWYCTDSWVGCRVYFFDDEPVSVSLQRARKSEEVMEWISREKYNTVKDYLLSFNRIDAISLVDMEQEMHSGYGIKFCGQILHVHKNAKYNEEEVKIIGCNSKDIICKKITIELKDGKQKSVDIGDLIFPWMVT